MKGLHRGKQAAAVTMAVLLAASISGCNGDDILGRNSKELKVQSYVTMDESNINALTGGQIKTVLVREGDLVKAGQELVALDNDTLNAQKDQADAAVRQAEASYQSLMNGVSEEQMKQLELAVGIAQSNLESAQSNLQKMQTDTQRMEVMLEGAFISQADMDAQRNGLVAAQSSFESAKSNLEISRSKLTDAQNGATEEQIAQAQAGVDQARAALLQIETTLDKAVLKSPVDGLVTNVNVKDGDVVSSGLPALVVADIYKPYITCNIDETDLSRVSLDQEVDVTLLATKDTVYKGKVTKINKAADFATKKASNESDFDILTFGITVEFEQPELLQENLRAGMTAYVDFGK